MNNLWATRQAAEAALHGPLQQEAAAVDMGFRILDLCADVLDSVDSPFAWVCGGVLAKGRNLGLACYSLSLDGLAQEGGAMFRPLLEVIEMLHYFSQDVNRAERVLQGKKLPKAGEIARSIHGSFMPLRNYLNEHASHIDFTYESMRHLFDVETGAWRKTQRHNDAVLRVNLKWLWLTLFLLTDRAIHCLEVSEISKASSTRISDIVEVAEGWRDVAYPLFGFPLPGATEGETP